MNAAELLKFLRCPETQQPLAAAPRALLEKLNEQVAAGKLRNRGGQVVTERIEGGYVRSDGKLLYPFRHDLPIMLIDEAIPVE
jgi:uncharacterized protein YbaR (Trm112 family)